MFGKVNIGEQEVEMLATASTAYRYQMIFHEDFLKRATEKTEFTDNIDMYQKVGFVMAMQAEKKDMTKINVDMFYAWLDEFSPTDMFDAVESIAELYNKTEAGSVSPE